MLLLIEKKFCDEVSGDSSDNFKISFFDCLLVNLNQMSEENNTFRQEIKVFITLLILLA